MLRASMSLVLKDGSRYSANNIQITDGPNFCRDGEPLKPHSVVSFLCSGKLLTFDAVVIERIEFRETGSVHCEGCDQRVDRAEDYPPRTATTT